ncbi:MAG: PspA/IM30 family protein [Alcanivorax sp.]|nr:PspA/IM30 family protein [Alcanivorax sp.]
MATAWNKFKTLLRGQARLQMEQIVSANDMLLLDQQLYDTEQSLREARRQLARLMAQQTLNGKRQQELAASIERYEDCARQALQQQDEALALATGERIAELQEQHRRHGQHGQALAQQEAEYRRVIQQAADQLKTLRQQQALARSQEALYGQADTRRQHSEGLTQRLCDSQQTLQQIQQRQEECRLLWQSEQQLVGADSDALDQRLAAAGIGDSRQQRAHEILARLRPPSTAG